MEETGAVQVQQGIGITQHLLEIVNDLRKISGTVDDEKKKEKYYDMIFQQLSKDEDRLLEEQEAEVEENPEKIAEFMSEMDGLTLENNNLYLEAIGMMIEFTNTEDPEMLTQAESTIKDADKILNEADDLNESLKSFLDEQDSIAEDQEEKTDE